MAVLIVLPSFVYGQSEIDQILVRIDSLIMNNSSSSDFNILLYVDSIAERNSLYKIIADSLHERGIKYYDDSYAYNIGYTLAAYKIRCSQNPKDPNAALSARNLGVFYFDAGNLLRSEEYTLKAKNIYDSIENLKGQIECSIDLGYLYEEIGDYQRSIEYNQFVSEQSPDTFDNETLTNYAMSFLNLGNLLFQLDSFDQSINKSKKAALYFYKLEEFKLLSQSFLNISNAYSEFDAKGLIDSTFKYYCKAIQLNTLDTTDLISIESNMGITYVNNNIFDKGWKYLNRSLNLAKAKGNKKNMAIPLDNLGVYYLKRNNVDSAIVNFKSAFSCLTGINGIRHLKEKDIAEITELKELLEIIKDLGKAFTEKFSATENELFLKDALIAYLKADHIIDQMRKEHAGPESKFYWRKKVKPVYEAAINVCDQLNDFEQAFYFFEKSKSILLLEGILRFEANTLIPNHLAKKEKRLRFRLNSFRRGEDNNQITEAQAVYDNFRSEIERDFPQYYEAKYVTTIPGLAEARSNLKDSNHLFLHTFWGEELVFLLAIGKNKLRMYKLARNESLYKKVESFLAVASNSTPDWKTYWDLAYDLYGDFFAKLFYDFSKPRSILIFPDGPLNFIPYDALLTAETDENMKFEEYPFQIKTCQTKLAYSYSILEKQRERGHENTNAKIFALAPFSIAGKGDFSTLSSSRDELLAIGNYFSTDTLFDEAATSSAFFEKSDKYAVIHISSHGIASAKSDESLIAFYDINLPLTALYDSLKLNADLVVLSACETSLGEEREGEGIMSFARGFTYAGASSLISSLWEVNQRATASLMKNFYKHLSEGKTKSDALHQAKLDYLETRTSFSPNSWSGFILIGDDSSLVKRTCPLWQYLILGMLVIITFWYFSRKMTKAKKA